jgi:hypothetical protein
LTFVPFLGTIVPDLGTEELEKKTLFPGTRRRIPFFFFMYPDRQFYFREVLKLTGTESEVEEAIQFARELDRLVKEWLAKNHPEFETDV